MAMQFDQQAAQRLVALYLTPDIVAQRAEVLNALAPAAGERVLDVGSGPGFLAAAIAERVGSAGRVCGVDISAPLLDYARTTFGAVPVLQFGEADATRLPFADASFDALVCTQVLEYVADVDTALAEFARVLRPGGRVVVMDTDWDSAVWNCSDPDRMARVLKVWDLHIPHPHLPSTLRPRLLRAGFGDVTARVVPLLNAVFETETYSNRIADLIGAFVAGRGGFTQAEVDAWLDDLRDPERRDQYFFSVNRYLFCGQRSAA